jgi:hypothetical protein
MTMTSWSISVDGVRAVLASVATDGEALTAAGSAFDVASASAVATVAAPTVSAALRSAMDEREDVADRMAATVRRAVGGASDATTAYLNGDEEMAANATARASAVDAWNRSAPPAGVDRGVWRVR